MDSHHTLIALAGAAVTASLLFPVTAGAAASGSATDPQVEPGTRPCFIWPAQWNEALDGPVPRCPTSTSTAASPAPALGLGRPSPPIL